MTPEKRSITRERLEATGGRLEDLFEILLPGESDGIRRLRKEAVALCQDIGARGALILGPAGSGKSTLARAISLGRYLHLLTPSKAKETMENVPIEPVARVSKHFMNWYEELPLTGLVLELADAQLFGIVEGAATGVKAKSGVFEEAATGHDSWEKRTEASQMTGGVVFLDEIGDLSDSLQPKLLAVLTGAEVSRVGSEGQDEGSYTFDGLTLAATWKDVRGELRPDLTARLSDHVLRVPSLSERREDLEELCGFLVTENQRQFKDWLERREKLKGHGFDVKRARKELERLEAFELAEKDREVLAEIDWRAYSDLRGLGQVIRRAMIRGVSITESLASQHEVSTRESASGNAAVSLYERVLECEPSDRALAGTVAAVEKDARVEFAEMLRENPTRLRRVAEHLEIQEAEIRSRLADLVRDRRSS